MLFAEKLRELRLAKGWSQKQLAEKAGASQQGLAKWESGERQPDFSSVVKLCRALGVHTAVFENCEFGEIEDKRRPGRPTNEEGVLAYDRARTKEAKAATKKKASKKK